MKRITILLVIVILSAGAAFAQSSDVAALKNTNSTLPLGVKASANPFSLIDFSRIKWSNSYSVAYFSGGGNSGSLGMLRTSMFYEFSPKLSLQVNLGVLHNPGAMFGNANTDARLLPGFRLDYRPSEKVHMSLGFQQYSGGYGPNGYYRPWSFGDTGWWR